VSANYFAVNPLDVHVEDGRYWVTCPECPGWTGAADSWDDLFRLVAEWHTGKHGWTMVEPLVTERLR
jgi:hypothetical protein